MDADYFVSLHSDSFVGESRMSVHWHRKKDGTGARAEQVALAADLKAALKEEAPKGVAVRSWGRPLGVLRTLERTIPGALIEMGNVQNKDDAARLCRMWGRIGTAWRIAAAIDKAVEP